MKLTELQLPDADAPKTMSQRKRQAILQAAIEEFQLKGFQGTSMDAISKCADVSKRTVYNHFASKEQLFEAIAHILFRYIHQMTQLKFDISQPLNQQLYEFAIREMTLFASEQYQELTRMMLAESFRLPDMAQRILSKMHQQESPLEQFIIDAISAKKLRAVEPSYAASQFLGLIKASAFWPQLMMNRKAPSETQSKQIAKDATEMFLGYYQSHYKAPTQ